MARARSRFTAAAVIGLVAVLGVTSCGEVQKLSAKDQVTDAMSNLESARNATFTMSLDTTVADVVAISKAMGEPMSAADQKSFASTLDGDVVVTMAAPKGKTFGDMASTQSAAASQDLTSLLNDPAALSKALKGQGSTGFVVHQGGKTLVDVRSVDGVLYATANLKQVFTLIGEDPKQIDTALTGLPPALSPLAEAAKGKWVSIDLAETVAAADESGLLSALPTASPTPTMDAAKLQKLLTSLKAAYQSKATITELGENDERGKGYRLAAPAKQVAQAVSDDLIALVGKTSEAQIRKAITEIPDQTFAVDLWVKDDKLSAVSLDLTQFLDKPVTGKKLALDLAVTTDSGGVQAPSGATKIDVKNLLSQLPTGALAGAAGAAGALGQANGSSTGLSSGGSEDAGFGAGGELSDEQLKDLQEQTGMSAEELKDMLGQGGQ